MMNPALNRSNYWHYQIYKMKLKMFYTILKFLFLNVKYIKMGLQKNNHFLAKYFFNYMKCQLFLEVTGQHTKFYLKMKYQVVKIS